MTAIASLAESFEGGANGDNITTLNSLFTTTSAGAPAKFTTADAISGTKSFTLGTLGSQSVNILDAPAAASGWVMFYIKPLVVPSTNTAFCVVYDGDTNKVLDLRLMTDGTLQLRSINTARWTSSALSYNLWHRIALFINVDSTGAGTCRVRIYSGTSLHSISSSQDSGTQLCSAVATTWSNIRFGAISGDTTMQYLLDYVRGDDTSEPLSITGGVPVNWFQGREVRIG